MGRGRPLGFRYPDYYHILFRSLYLNSKTKDQYKDLVNTTGLSVLSYMLLLITVVYLLPLFNFRVDLYTSISSIFILCVIRSYFNFKPIRFIYDLFVYSLIAGLLVYLL